MADRKHKVGAEKLPGATKDKPIFVYQISTDKLALMVLLETICVTQAERAAATASKVTEFVKKLNQLADEKEHKALLLEAERAEVWANCVVACVIAAATCALSVAGGACSRSGEDGTDPVLAASISLAKLLVNRKEDDGD